MRKKQRDTLSRSAMKLLCTLLGIVLGLMVAVSWGFSFFMNQVFPSAAATGGSLPAFSLSSTWEGAQKAVGLSLGTRESNVVNILLIGQDSREGESQARSDSMILCTLDREADRLTTTSFLRDLYLPIPGHGSNRINAAYSFGGMPLLKQTLEENFGITIDGAIEVDFQQFSRIIDMLGGVSIELRQDEAEFLNRETGSDLTEGTHTLTGHQALTYSRIRSLDADGDFSRTNRQRKVITALLGSYRNVRFSELIPTINTLLPMISTDLNQAQILLYALEVLPALSDAQITSQRVPADGTYTDQTIDGMSVLVADMDTARQLLRESLQKS